MEGIGSEQPGREKLRGMASAYDLVILHAGLDELASEVRDAIRAATGEIHLQPDLVTFTDELDLVVDHHAAVVYLGNTAGPGDADVNAQLQLAIGNDIPILPLVRQSDFGKVSEKLPDSIKRVNAIDWDARRGEAKNALLAMLGLTEADRRVFLSYFQTETTSFAIQLHTSLAQGRFDVFLDRFTVPPGVDFQQRLDQDLGDKAFVVLIESPGLRSSHWVEHEIAYAHSHRIGILAITMPGTAAVELVPSVDEAFRVRLGAGELQADGRLSEPAIGQLLDRIEIAHARELRRRREQLMGSLRDKLFLDGCACEPLGEWALLASAPGCKTGVFMVTPRRPRPEDLYALHLVHLGAAAATGDELTAAVVHETEHISDEDRRLLEWIGAPRQFEATLLRGCALKEEPAA